MGLLGECGRRSIALLAVGGSMGECGRQHSTPCYGRYCGRAERVGRQHSLLWESWEDVGDSAQHSLLWEILWEGWENVGDSALLAVGGTVGELGGCGRPNTALPTMGDAALPAVGGSHSPSVVEFRVYLPTRNTQIISLVPSFIFSSVSCLISSLS